MLNGGLLSELGVEWSVGESPYRRLGHGSALGQNYVGYCLTLARQYNVNNKRLHYYNDAPRRLGLGCEKG